jgi:hypothetical protein
MLSPVTVTNGKSGIGEENTFELIANRMMYPKIFT